MNSFASIVSLLKRYDVLLFLGCIFFFILWPEFDLYISSYFYDSAINEFTWSDHFLIQSVYQLTHYLGTILVVSLPAILVFSYVLKNDYFIKKRTLVVYLICAIVIGPGLVVNGVFKGNWERPRPVKTSYFGGDKAYEAPFSPTFQCRTCRSFVSGHASVGFFFFAIALLAKRKIWLVAPLLAGVFIGTGRIAQGGHFFSDVLFSGWLIWFSSVILYTLFKKYLSHERMIVTDRLEE